MTRAAGSFDGYADAALLGLLRAIASGDAHQVMAQLEAAPALASRALQAGATRDEASTYFLTSVRHYVYAGDTALHVAAATHHRPLAEALLAHGADVRARNRRGAEPLHYAADGGPGRTAWNGAGQGEVIALLIEAGANPNALDNSGGAALHRAVRARRSDAVSVLLDHGADPRHPNRRGSSPLHLAVLNTGNSNSGSDIAKEEQRRIIYLLLDHGAAPSDLDAKGKTVTATARSEWIRRLLQDQ